MTVWPIAGPAAIVVGARPRHIVLVRRVRIIASLAGKRPLRQRQQRPDSPRRSVTRRWPTGAALPARRSGLSVRRCSCRTPPKVTVATRLMTLDGSRPKRRDGGLGSHLRMAGWLGSAVMPSPARRCRNVSWPPTMRFRTAGQRGADGQRGGASAGVGDRANQSGGDRRTVGPGSAAGDGRADGDAIAQTRRAASCHRRFFRVVKSSAFRHPLRRGAKY